MVEHSADVFKLLLEKLFEKEKPSPKTGVKLRCRPVVKLILRRYALPYILSLAQKQCFSFTSDSVSFLSYTKPISDQLLTFLNENAKDTFDYATLQTLSTQFMREAVDFISHHPKLGNRLFSLSSSGLILDWKTVINKRRRQEDRWFAVADISNYALEVNEVKGSTIPNDSHPSIAAFGVFDGHNGPEVAEHCSHLAPYWLSLGFQNRTTRPVPIPDVLADVFYRLNESAVEGHTNKYWLSGATGTMCIFVNDQIYTAWVGDSQAWLVYADDEDGSEPIPVKQQTTESDLAFQVPSSPNVPDNINAEDCPQPMDQCKPIVNGKTSPTERETNLEAQTMAVMSDRLEIPLTDRIHRPEFAPEFVSIIRTGGSVSTVVERHGSSPVIDLFTGVSSGHCKKRDAPLDIDGLLKLPRLLDPNLTECRVGGLSCVSRSIGDAQSISGVSTLPSCTIWSSSQSAHLPLCLIIASDGLWDTQNCSGPEVARIARNWFREHRTEQWQGVDIFLSQYLTQLAIENGASDNVTCLVIWLHQWKPAHSECIDGDGDFGVDIRWVQSTRTASLVDLNNVKELSIRGPRDIYLSQCTQESSDVASRPLSLFAGSIPPEQRVRLSSPPRYKFSLNPALPAQVLM